MCDIMWVCIKLGNDDHTIIIMSLKYPRVSEIWIIFNYEEIQVYLNWITDIL